MTSTLTLAADEVNLDLSELSLNSVSLKIVNFHSVIFKLIPMTFIPRVCLLTVGGFRDQVCMHLHILHMQLTRITSALLSLSESILV